MGAIAENVILGDMGKQAEQARKQCSFMVSNLVLSSRLLPWVPSMTSLGDEL